MLKLICTISIILVLAGQSFAQTKPNGLKAWKLTSYSGSIGIRGFYRQQEQVLNTIRDFSQFPFLYGSILVNTKSYIGHPNLLLLEVGGEYNPGTSQQTYTVSPDRSEVLTFTRLNLGTTLFPGKPMSLGAHLNFSQNFINREYVTSVKTDARQWGLTYFYRNKIAPLTVSYSDRKWDQVELDTDRTYRNQQTDFQAQITKTFTKNNDNNELRYTRFYYFREDQNIVQSDNLYDNLILNNSFNLDRRRRYSVRSSINYLDQEGNLSQKRFQMNQSASLKLPYKMRLGGDYNFTNVEQATQQFKQQRINVNLDHELYSSLQTGVFYQHYKTNHTAFTETNTQVGIGFNYIKKIPTGTLNLSYSYRRHIQNVVSNPGSTVQIVDEEHTLTDGQVELLDRPFINVSSIVVKDLTNSVIYQENFDYLLTERDEFVEITRVPGGQIPNNSAVLVDYFAAQVGPYKFNADLESYAIRVVLFERLLELYYVNSNQDYNNIESGDFLTLNYFTHHVFGGRMQLGVFAGGVERNEFRSTIVPYEKMRYYLQVNGKIGAKWLLSMNGEYTDLILTDTNTKQLYSTLYGKAIYQIKPQTKINVDLGYRKQIGEQIDLDLITAKAEFNTIYRKLYMKVGLELYKRNYVGQELNFNGIYFQIDRKF